MPTDVRIISFTGETATGRTIMERDAPVTTTMEIATDDRAIAIAAAWWYIQQKKRGSLGKRLEDTPGGWWNNPSNN